MDGGERRGALRGRLRRVWALELLALRFGGGARLSYGLGDLAKGLLLGLALFLFSEADPFGIGDATERHSAEIFQRLVARSYDRGPASDQIRVVLLTDRYVEQRGPWPLPYSVHAEILATLLGAGPRAVFVDFGFLDERGDGGDFLAEVAALYEEESVPLFFVRGQASSGRPSGVIAALGQARLVSGAFWPGRYELFDCRLGVPSAALAMARSRLAEGATDPTDGYLAPAGCPDAQTLAAVADWPYRPPDCPGNLEGGDPRLCMDVVWSDWEGGDEGSNGAQRCKVRGDWGPLMAFDPLYAFLEGLGLPFVAPFGGQSCGPHRTVTAAALAAAERAAFLEPDPERRLARLAELSDFFAGRYVLYGAHIEMSDDTFQPPTHLRLPGVYYHAMALDNLLAFGLDGYKVQAPHLGGRPVGWQVELAGFLVATLIAGFFARAAVATGEARWVPPEDYRAALLGYLRHSLLWSLLGLLALLLFLAAMVYLQFTLLDWGPVNFVGLFGLQFAWWISYLRRWLELMPRRVTPGL